MNIQAVTQDNYQELIEVWEASVRATHDFLPEENIAKLKPLILQHYFDAVELRCIKNGDDKILGFIGVSDSNIEMLFVDPAYLGQSIGRQLTEFAINQLQAQMVDVNEQNPKAVGFYEHMGFKVVSRSPLDDMGKPFPILHMTL